MKRYIKTIIFSFLILLSFNVKAQDNSQFYLITCEPGDEIYTLFGHSALRYEDKDRGLDIVFNYGLFNFDTPNFLWKFVLGETDYLLGYTNYNHFVKSYKREGRQVYQDTLNLTSEEKHLLFENLRVNLQANNRIYRYNYLRNNCSTKITEQIDKATQKNVTWIKKGKSDYTYRDLLDRYLKPNTWNAVGIYLALGATCDQKATWEETMFLPRELQEAYIDAKKSSGTKITQGKTRPLLRNLQPVESGKTLSPWMVFVAYLTMVIAIIALKKKRIIFNIGVRLFWLLNSIAGLILAFLCFVSIHPLTGWNLNILVLNPLTLLFVFLNPINSKHKKLHRSLHIAYIICLIVFVISTMIFQIQTIHPVVYLLAFTYLLLGIAYMRYSRFSENK